MFCVDCEDPGYREEAEKPIANDVTVAFDYRVTNSDDGTVMTEGCGTHWRFPDTGSEIDARGDLSAEYTLELTNTRYVDMPTDLSGFDACLQTESSPYPEHDDPSCYKLGRYAAAFELLDAFVVDAAGNRVLSTTSDRTFPSEPGDIERFHIRSYDYDTVEVLRDQPPCSSWNAKRSLLEFGPL